MTNVSACGKSTVFSVEDLGWTLGSPDSASTWRHICAMARAEELLPSSWHKWLVAGDVEEDVLSFCIRKGRFKTFVALVDLAFIFHWDFLEYGDHALLESAFLNALDLADTNWRLDVHPDPEPDELMGREEGERRRKAQIRRDNLMRQLTLAIVAYLRRVPAIARKDELEKLKGKPFLDPATLMAIGEAYEIGNAREMDEAMHSLELEARGVARPSSL